MLKLFLFSNWKFPKIPTGLTWLGFTSLTYAAFSNRRRNAESAELRRQQEEFQSRIHSDIEAIRSQTDEILRNQNKSVKDKFLDLFSKKSDNYTEDSIIDSIKSFIEDYTNFLFNLTFEQQIILLNLLGSILILNYVISILIIIYSTYLIEKFDLENRYPRIAIFLKYRNKFQKYFIYWNVFLIFVLLIVMITINFLLFIDFYL